MATATAEWSLWSTSAQVTVTDPAQLAESRRIVEGILHSVEEASSRFRSDSELESLRDRLPGGATVSPMLAMLVGHALQAAQWTDGDVDPTLGYALAAAGYDRDIGELLSARPLDAPSRFSVSVAERRAPGWTRVTLADQLLTVPADLALDLGASAKAVAADLSAASVHEQVGCGVLIALGGDIATAGEAPEGGWQILVQDTPSDPATQITLLSGFALATSSTQKRRWSVGGQNFHHILDPRIGLPAEPVWRSVTVSAPTCLRANALSTASIVRGHRAIDWLGSVDATARLVDREGRVTTVGAWPAETS